MSTPCSLAADFCYPFCAEVKPVAQMKAAAKPSADKKLIHIGSPQ
jgi:hypothetical protein